MSNINPSLQNGVSRRRFLASGSAAVGAAWAGSALAADADATSGPAMPMATLGRTGVRVSRLAIGCAPLQRDRVTHTSIETLLDRAHESGVNYLDIAPNYGNAEEKIGPVLRSVRDRFFLVTKCEEPSYDGAWRLLKQSLARMKTDRIDVLHLHNFGNEERFPDLKEVFGKRGAMQCFREAKKQGIVRFLGATGHLHPSRFRVAIDSGEIDVLMNAVNFIVRHTYNFEEKSFARARRHAIGLVAMKVLGGWGQQGVRDGSGGFRIPQEHYRNAIRYALSLPGVSTAVIGIENVDEFEQAAKVVRDSKPLSTAEFDSLSQSGASLAKDSEWAVAYGQPLT